LTRPLAESSIFCDTI